MLPFECLFLLLPKPDSRNRAILTILQIESAADDPLTRYTALFSLMCALISLLFGCMYIIRFGSMRKSYKAAEWALVSLFGSYEDLVCLILHGF